MKAFKDTLVTKEELVNELKTHQIADNFIRGQYFEDGKGCAVGCSLESVSRIKNLDIETYDHGLYEKYFNVPKWFAMLTDTLFEGMSLEESKTFPLDIIEAINIGSDLNKIENKFKIMVLNKNIETLEKLDDDYGIIKIAKDVIKGLQTNDTELLEKAESAARSARSAAESAAWSAARSAAWLAAKSVARSATLSVRSAALSVAESPESYSVVTYDYFADELIKLVKELKC